MGMIDDIFGLVRKGPQLASQIDRVKINNKTVVGGAADATFQFPLLASNTIPIDMASTIARNMECVYVAATQQWLSLNPTIDITMDRNIIQYLKKFHQNVSLESVMNEFLKEKVITESYDTVVSNYDDKQYALYLTADRRFGILFNKSDRPTAMMLESHKDFLNEHLHMYDLKEFPHIGNSLIVKEAPEDEGNPMDGMVSADVAQMIIDNRKLKKAKEDRDERMKQTNLMKAPQMTNMDIKKVNDMTPYAIQVRLMAVNDRNEFVQFMDFVVGVKTILHPIDSDEVVSNIERAVKNQSVFFKFLRWTTGEISLVKNLLLNIDDIRSDVINRSSGKSPWFGQLKRLKDRHYSLHDFTVPHSIIPNATLAVTISEAEYIREHFGIDITDAKTAQRVIDSMFLMTFIIVDDGTGTVDILYKDAGSFQTYSLETLEREVSLNSNKLGREIGRMISH